MAAFGDRLLLRYRYSDGGFQAALPVRVVEDATDRLVVWLAEGTEIMYWATKNGQDPRCLPLGDRFAAPLATAPRLWAGGGVLRTLLPGSPYQVLHFWKPDGAFSHWYVNFEAPMTRHRTTVETVDWHLDLVINADGSWRWKDEDEAGAAALAGHLRPEHLTQARSIGDTLTGEFPALLDRVGDWREFRPPVEWDPLGLPADWATSTVDSP